MPREARPERLPERPGVAGAVPLVYFVVSLLLGRECARRAALNNEARAAVTGRIVDVITNIRNVFLFANQPLEDRQVKTYTGTEFERRRASYRAVVRLRCVQYLMDIAMWLGFVGGALIIWITSNNFETVITANVGRINGAFFKTRGFSAISHASSPPAR